MYMKDHPGSHKPRKPVKSKPVKKPRVEFVPGDLCGLEAVDEEMSELENFFKTQHSMTPEAHHMIGQMIKRIRDLETDKDFMKRSAEDALITICSR